MMKTVGPKQQQFSRFICSFSRQAYLSLALRKRLHPENKRTTTRVRGQKNGETAYTSLCAMVMRLLSCGVSRVGLPGKVGDRENEVLRAFNVQHAQIRYEEGRDTSKNVWDKVGESE